MSKTSNNSPTEVLADLKALGNEKVRLQNKKQGAQNNQFGLKLGDLRKLAKKIKPNQELALSLWDTGNLDAQFLAILLTTPVSLSNNQLDQMVRSIAFVRVADWFNAYILKEHPDKESLRKKWMEDKDKWAARSGWSLTAGKISRNAEDLDLNALLDRIESEMTHALPEVQWTMNTALAQIGIHHPHVRQRALYIGEKLGIYRDYPTSKGCTSPFAPIWINEMVRRQS